MIKSTDFIATQSRCNELNNLTTSTIVSATKEVAKRKTKRTSKNVKFCDDEDDFLNIGIKKYGRKSWTMILKDDNFKFHQSSRDSLKVRADSAAFKKKIVILIILIIFDKYFFRKKKVST